MNRTLGPICGCQPCFSQCEALSLSFRPAPRTPGPAERPRFFCGGLKGSGILIDILVPLAVPSPLHAAVTQWAGTQCFTQKLFPAAQCPAGPSQPDAHTQSRVSVLLCRACLCTQAKWPCPACVASPPHPHLPGVPEPTVWWACETALLVPVRQGTWPRGHSRRAEQLVGWFWQEMEHKVPPGSACP